MVSFEAMQVPFDMVHTNEFVPAVKPVIAEVAELVVVTVADPAITDHNPVPTVGVLAVKVAVVLQVFWSTPALAVVGAALMVIFDVFILPVTTGLEDTTRTR